MTGLFRLFIQHYVVKIFLVEFTITCLEKLGTIKIMSLAINQSCKPACARLANRPKTGKERDGTDFFGRNSNLAISPMLTGKMLNNYTNANILNDVFEDSLLDELLTVLTR